MRWLDRLALRDRSADEQDVAGQMAEVARDGVEAIARLLRARAVGSALAEPFFAPGRSALSPDEIAEAERRAAAPLPEPTS
jgi:hypothetical protein